MQGYYERMQPFPGLERWSWKVQLPKNNVRLHLYDTGGNADPSILLIHGLGDEADTWRHVLPLLVPNSRAIAVDLPGFGLSEKGRFPYTIPFFVQIIAELMDHMSIRKAVLVGHSTGGIIAHEFALQHPELVERLVLIGGSLLSTGNRFNLNLLTFLVPGLGELMYTSLRYNTKAAYRSLEPYYFRLEDLPRLDRDFLHQRVNDRVHSSNQRRGFLATLRGLARWLPAQQKHLPGRLSSCSIPTAIVWGEKDKINPVQNARALAELLPEARLVIVPKSGHNVQQERPDVVAEAILSPIKGTRHTRRKP